MQVRTRAMMWIASISLSACGSDSSPPSPAPTPTPTPTATVSPLPSPTATPTGALVTTEAGSHVAGSIQYADPTGNGTARWSTDFMGQFPTASARLASTSLISSGFQPDYTKLVYKLSNTGIDLGSRLLISASAPAGASVVSPITTLIDTVGNQSLARNALQLDSGVFAIPSSVDLTTVAGTASTTNAGLIAAANFRALLLSQAVYVVQRGAGALDYTPFTLQNRETDIGTFIRNNNSVQLYTEAGAEQLLRTYGDRSIGDATYAAMAHLIVAYAQASTAIQSDASQSTRFLLGLQSFFFYRMQQLRNNPGAATSVQALTPQALAQELQPFADYPTFTATGTLFAGPDFDFLTPGSSATRPRWNQERDGHGQRRTSGYAENDFTFNSATLSFDSVYTNGALESVTVPSANANQIKASASGTRIDYQALPGFTGITYFDYTLSDRLGQKATARFYVIVQ